MNTKLKRTNNFSFDYNVIIKVFNLTDSKRLNSIVVM